MHMFATSDSPPFRFAEASRGRPVQEIQRLLVPGGLDGADARQARRVHRAPGRRHPC
jgi:hypothetical protein